MAKAYEEVVTRRIVLDTNIRISSLLFGGAPRELMRRLQPPFFLPMISEALLLELARILERKFRWSQGEIAAQLEGITASSLLIVPTQIILACRDSDDNRVLECALTGHAECIITGDRDLLALHPFERIPILTVRQFLDQLSSPASSPFKPIK